MTESIAELQRERGLAQATLARIQHDLKANQDKREELTALINAGIRAHFSVNNRVRDIDAALAASALLVPVVAEQLTACPSYECGTVTGEHSALCMSAPEMTSPDQRGNYRSEP